MTAAADVADILIVGGGLAAVRTAQALRSGGFEGSIVLASEENELPYDRPPLSKNVAEGSATSPLVADDALRAARIEVRLGHHACGLDLVSHRVELADGAGSIAFGRLVVATGVRARELPALAGAPHTGTLRTRSDGAWLARRMVPGGRVAVIGAGFIGLEVAATARSVGCEVTVIEAAPAPLERAVGPELGEWLIRRHREQGVTVRCGVTVAGWHAADDVVTLALSDGHSLLADAVVVGVGVTRELAWLADAGLSVHEGLLVDAFGRTNHPQVFGVGDVTCVHGDQDACTVTQHWTATTLQARRVSAAMLGAGPPPAGTDEGFVWSDQYDLRIQLVGTVAGTQAQIVEDTDAAFLAEYYRGDRLVGAAAVNRPRELLSRRQALRRVS